MPLSDFYGIMEALVGTPTNDVQATLLYITSIMLAASTLMFFYKLFDMMASFFNVSNFNKKR